MMKMSLNNESWLAVVSALLIQLSAAADSHQRLSDGDWCRSCYG